MNSEPPTINQHQPTTLLFSRVLSTVTSCESAGSVQIQSSRQSAIESNDSIVQVVHPSKWAITLVMVVEIAPTYPFIDINKLAPSINSPKSETFRNITCSPGRVQSTGQTRPTIYTFVVTLRISGYGQTFLWDTPVAIWQRTRLFTLRFQRFLPPDCFPQISSHNPSRKMTRIGAGVFLPEIMATIELLRSQTVCSEFYAVTIVLLTPYHYLCSPTELPAEIQQFRLQIII